MRATPSVLLERESELARLDDALEQASLAAGSAVAVVGEPGVGKTALLRATRDAAQARGFNVLAATSAELERDLAFGAVRRLLESGDPGRDGSGGLLAASVAALEDDPTGLDRQYGFSHQLAGELALAAEKAPVLVCLDDAHWADPASLRVLHYLASRSEGQRVLIVIGSRTGESDEPLLQALVQPPTQVLRPSRLSQRATTELIETTVGAAVAESLVRQCQEASGGNPFFLVELINSLVERDVALDATSPWEVELPENVVASVQARLARRSPQARAVARAIAVLGHEAPAHHVAALADVDSEVALTAGAELAQAGILRRDRPFTFEHPLISAAVRASLDTHALALAHQQAAAAHLRDGASPAAVAAHLLHTAPAGRQETVGVLRQAAADAAARGAASAAAPLLRRALQEPPPAEERGALLGSLGVAELELGELPSALEHLREGLGLATSSDQLAERAVPLAFAGIATGGIAAGVDVLDAALAQVPTDEHAVRLVLEAHAIRLCLFDARLYERGWGRLAALPEPPGLTPAERAILAMKSCQQVFFGGTATEAARLARLACAGGHLAEDPGFDSMPFGIAMSALVEAGELDFGLDELTRARARAHSRNAPGDLTVILVAQALVDHRRGDLHGLDETIALARMAMSATAGSHLDVALAPALGATESVVRAEAGDAAGTDAALASGGMDGAIGEDPNVRRLLGWRIRGHLALGRHDAAAADIAMLRAHQEETGIAWDPSSPWRVWQAQVLAASGGIDAARDLAEAELAHARRWGTPFALGMALRARGSVEHGAAAAPWSAEAVDAFEASGDAVESARARVEHGEALFRAGDVDHARVHLVAGMDRATRAGANGLSKRARQVLVQTGARPRRDRSTGIDSLTGAERRVAAMAAQGLSNREIAQGLFVSIKTVEGHLRQGFTKLGISRRSELTAWWPER